MKLFGCEVDIIPIDETLGEGIPRGSLYLVPPALKDLILLYLFRDKVEVDELIEKYMKEHAKEFAVIKNIKLDEEIKK